jgi:hypothetical protein
MEKQTAAILYRGEPVYFKEIIKGLPRASATLYGYALFPITGKYQLTKSANLLLKGFCKQKQQGILCKAAERWPSG